MNALTSSFTKPTLESSSDLGAPSVARLNNVTKRFGATTALERVSLSIRRGEVLGLIGRSGAGKSTLIRCLNGLERPDSGGVEIEGRSIIGLGEREMQPLRRRIGIVFQHFNLMSAKTVAENIALPLKIEGQPRADRKARVAELLDLIGLADKADAYPARLSGGQKQRVGIARALAARPALLLSDEATSALDPETTDSILELLRDINRDLDLTILLVTHEMGVARAIADRVAVLDGGRIIEQGPTWQIFAAPGAATTRSLLRADRPKLPDELSARLVAGPGKRTLLKVVVLGDQARAPLLAELALATGLRAVLLHGGVDHVRGEAVGALFLDVDGRDRAGFSAALGFLRERARWRCSVMSTAMLELLWRSFVETLVMTSAAGFVSLALGLPLGLLLVMTDRHGVLERIWLNRLIGAVVNAVRSVPFIILLVAAIPLTRWIVGTSIGVSAAIVPLSLAAIPYYARIAELSFREVDPGLIEAARAMGGSRWTIVSEVLVPEALPGLASGFTVTLVTLIGASAMAGAVGSGGLGDLAIRYGYQRFDTDVMMVVVLVLIALVSALQRAGGKAAARFDKRKPADAEI